MLVGASIGLAALGAATFAGFHSMLPESQLYGASFTGAERGAKTLALTYDDGPNDPYTGRLLDVLARHEVKATFFMLGKFVEQRPKIARDVCLGGHVVGNHTFEHKNLIFASEDETRRQLERTQKAIEDYACTKPVLFRPPWGARKPGTFAVARGLGLTPVMWRVTCYDWKATTPERVVAHAARQIGGGDVILLHDGGYLAMGSDRSHTVKATDELIRRYKGEGYSFVTVPEMMEGSSNLRIAGSSNPKA